eukprot:g8096.t1
MSGTAGAEDHLLSRAVHVRRKAEAIIAESLADDASARPSRSTVDKPSDPAALSARARQAQRLLARSIAISQKLHILDKSEERRGDTVKTEAGTAAPNTPAETAAAAVTSTDEAARDGRTDGDWEAYQEARKLADSMQGWLSRVADARAQAEAEAR